MLSGLFLPVVVVGSDEITRDTVSVAADTALGNPDINSVSYYCLGIAVTSGESVRDIAAADAVDRVLGTRKSKKDACSHGVLLNQGRKDARDKALSRSF